MTNITGGKTLATPLVFDPIATDAFKYNIVPLITKGDQVALLTGDPLAAIPTTDPTQLFTMQDKPDGLGLKQINGLNYVWMNHELDSGASNSSTPLGSGLIQGARVSLFIFDSDWNIIGGKNLLERVTLGSATYNLNTTTGYYESGINRLSFSRFCSGYLAETGFFGSDGTTETAMWLMGEGDYTIANNGGHGYGLAIAPDGNGTIIAGLGKYKKKTVVSHRSYRPLTSGTANSGWTVLISSEDNADGEIYLYVGKQTAANPNGLWSNSGADGSNFALYVLRVVNPTTGQAFAGETMAENQVMTTQWVEVPDAVALGTGVALSNWVNGTDPQGVVRSTDFENPEDTAPDPLDPNTFYFTTTGSSIANPRGKVHKLTVDIDPITGRPINGIFENLLVSGPGKGARYDNLVADGNGNLVLQTDGDNPEVGLVYNIAANANRVGNDILTPIYQLTNNSSGESSGIIEVSPNTAAPGQSSYLLNVQRTAQGQLILIDPTSATAGPGLTDTKAPTVNFLLDQSASDFNKIENFVLSTEIQSQFQFQLSDALSTGNPGSGINPTSVTSNTITITRNGLTLVESIDYSFAYDSTTELITINSLSGGFNNGLYQISVNNIPTPTGITDNAGNRLNSTSFTLDIDTTLQFAGFEQGLGGYTGTTDTYLAAASAAENFSTFDTFKVDGMDGTNPLTGNPLPVQGLLRFDNIIGFEQGQIPFNATIISAALDLWVQNRGDRVEFYRMLTPWESSSTWNSLSNGIQTDGIEATRTPDASTVSDVTSDFISVNVASSIREWQKNPQANYGWALLPTGTNGVDFKSSENSLPPALVVEYKVNEITGTSVGEAIQGSINNDVIRGLDGNDTIIGGAANDILDGGIGSDLLEGGNGQDYLIGRAGKDILSGGMGSDFFIFLSPNEGVDLILDFNASDLDKIQISAAGFGGGLQVGSLDSSQYYIGTAAITASHRIIYNNTSGALFFDRDGVGGAAQVQFATLLQNQTLNLFFNNFEIIA